MRFQSGLFCLAVVVVAGTNLPTLVKGEGGQEQKYPACIWNVLLEAAGTTFLQDIWPDEEAPEVECLDEFLDGMDEAIDGFKDHDIRSRGEEMKSAYQKQLKTITECFGEPDMEDDILHALEKAASALDKCNDSKPEEPKPKEPQSRGTQSRRTHSRGTQPRGTQSRGTQSRGAQSRGSRSRGSHSRGSQFRVNSHLNTVPSKD